MQLLYGALVGSVLFWAGFSFSRLSSEEDSRPWLSIRMGAPRLGHRALTLTMDMRLALLQNPMFPAADRLEAARMILMEGGTMAQRVQTVGPLLRMFHDSSLPTHFRVKAGEGFLWHGAPWDRMGMLTHFAEHPELTAYKFLSPQGPRQAVTISRPLYLLLWQEALPLLSYVSDVKLLDTIHLLAKQPEKQWKDTIKSTIAGYRFIRETIV